jgi:hypothetical protein
MGNTESIAALTSSLQDAELTTALTGMQNNPAALQTYLQRAQDKLYNNVTQQKDDTFQKVYGDLERASTTERAVYHYYKRNRLTVNTATETRTTTTGATNNLILSISTVKHTS